MSRLLLSVWADHTQNPNTCQPRTGLTGSTQAEDTKYRHQSGHSYSLQAASSSGAQAGIKEFLFCCRYSWQPTFTLHLQCSLPESLRSAGLSERVMIIHQRANSAEEQQHVTYLTSSTFHLQTPFSPLTDVFALAAHKRASEVCDAWKLYSCWCNTNCRFPPWPANTAGVLWGDTTPQLHHNRLIVWQICDLSEMTEESTIVLQMLVSREDRGGVEVPRRITQTTKKHAV